MTKTQQSILDRVTADFRFRVCPSGADPNAHHDREAVRSVLGIAAMDLVRLCPQSRELNHALNEIDVALGWAHSAIDRHGVHRYDEDSA